MIINDDCLVALKALPENSIDSLVTDPPAGISFMGKDWDKDKGGREPWIAWMTEVMSECFRVLKPGAHGLVWAIPRTSHWTATALENAGFEVRDVVTHLFGSGFPKSLNIGKQVKEYEGWGTALKPASEHWILVRKPISEKTVAANVLKHGVGGINIDGCRVGSDKIQISRGKGFANKGIYEGGLNDTTANTSHQGRFPANLLLSHTLFCEDTCTEDCPVRLLDEQSGVSKSPPSYVRNADGLNSNAYSQNMGEKAGKLSLNFGDSGGASRFFYVAKASKKDRNEGLEGMPEVIKPLMGEFKSNPGRETPKSSPTPRANFHPTVKPTKLMEYLITLVTPPNGVVLDPFMGSGSTGKAARRLGFDFIGIEREEEYYKLAQRRLDAF